jgi:hypothetical protein
MPDRAPGDPGAWSGGDQPLFAFYMATIRVEIDPRDGAVTDVLVDEGTMAHPTLVARADGTTVTGIERVRAEAVLSSAEWPSWDYGSARFGPASPAERSQSEDS